VRVLANLTREVGTVMQQLGTLQCGGGSSFVAGVCVCVCDCVDVCMCGVMQVFRAWREECVFVSMYVWVGV
jgi:hypothetical protein